MAIAIRPDQMGRDDLIPFRRGTREHFQLIGDVTYTSGRSGTPRRLDNVGFLAGVLVHVTGTMNLVGAQVLTADGPWQLIRRLRLALNTGPVIFDTTGFGAFVRNFFIKEEFAPNVSGLADVFAAPTAGGNNTWSFFLWMPIAANLGLNFEAGLLNLQTEELIANVEIDWGAETDAVVALGGGTGFTGRADIYAHHFEVPDPNEVRYPPLNLIFVTKEDRTPITGVGGDGTRYPVLRQGTLHQLIHIVRLNGARNTTDVVRLALEFNRGDRVYRYTRQAQLWWQAMQYGQDLPAGVFAWDWWSRSQGDVSQGDARDFINTEAVAQTDTITELAAAAVLGANNNFLDSLRVYDQVLTP